VSAFCTSPPFCPPWSPSALFGTLIASVAHLLSAAVVAVAACALLRCLSAQLRLLVARLAHHCVFGCLPSQEGNGSGGGGGRHNRFRGVSNSNGADGKEKRCALHQHSLATDTGKVGETMFLVIFVACLCVRLFVCLACRIPSLGAPHGGRRILLRACL
jgi:hypothetical protein